MAIAPFLPRHTAYTRSVSPARAGSLFYLAVTGGASTIGDVAKGNGIRLFLERNPDTLRALVRRPQDFQNGSNLFSIIGIVEAGDFLVVQIAQALDLLFHQLEIAVPQHRPEFCLGQLKRVIRQQIELGFVVNRTPNKTPKVWELFLINVDFLHGPFAGHGPAKIGKRIDVICTIFVFTVWIRAGDVLECSGDSIVCRWVVIKLSTARLEHGGESFGGLRTNDRPKLRKIIGVNANEMANVRLDSGG